MGNGFVGICTDTKVIVLRYPACGQSCTPPQSMKYIRIVVPTVLGELRFGHTTSVSSRNGWVGVSYFGKCPTAVPCATADEESGSNLKLGSCVDQPYVLLSAR